MSWVDNTLIMTGKNDDLMVLMKGRLRFNKIFPDAQIKEGHGASIMPRISKSDMVLLDDMRQPTMLVNFHSFCEPPTKYLNYLTTQFIGLKIVNTYIDEEWSRVGHSYSVNGKTTISLLHPGLYSFQALERFSYACEWFNYDLYRELFPISNISSDDDVVLSTSSL